MDNTTRRRFGEFVRNMQGISGIGDSRRLIGRGIRAVRRRLGRSAARGNVGRVAPAEIYDGDAANGMFDLADLDEREARRRNANTRQFVRVGPV